MSIFFYLYFPAEHSSCCRSLLQIVQAALQKAKRKVPVKAIIISTQGEVLS
jgi:hypothetical protein